MLRWIQVSMACLAGCTSAAVPPRTAAPPPQPPSQVSGPLLVAFGACSNEHSQWVSRPRPMPPAVARDPNEAAIEQARAAGILGTSPVEQGGAITALTGTGDSSSGSDDTNIYGGLLGNEVGSAGGGTGTGSGSDAGVGWGTIDTGRYGAIGHGSGTGTGYGVDDGGEGHLRGHYPAVPSLTLGQPLAKGSLDKAIIRRYVKRNLMKLRYCYEKQLLAKPGIKGTIATHFTIAPSGDVASATSTGFDPDVASCVQWVFQSIQFPKPTGNGSVEVSYPITYRPGTPPPTHTAAGDLDKAIIRRYVKRNIQKIQYCYEKQLLVTPAIKGTIHTKFFITPSGKVSTATATGFDPTVASCVAGVIQQIEFPKPKGGGGVAVTYPFVFEPAGDSSSSTAGSGSGAGSDVTPPATPPAAPAPPPAAPAPPPASDPADQVAAVNPLQPLAADLSDCVRHNPVAYGAIVVELHYGDTRAVSSVNVYGLDGAAARACVVAVAKRTRPSTYATAQRCSLSFGQMPTDALPAIDLAGDAITFGGHALAAPQPGSPPRAIDGLVSALAASQHPAGANAPVVSVQETLLVRPADATPMYVVYDVRDSVRAAGEGFVLATHRGAGWRLLRDDLTLPGVPALVDPPAAPDDERVNLSVYIGKDHVWVGLSRVNEFTQLERGPDLAAALAKALAAQKASAFFADRTDIEIGADDSVSYGDVVSAIDAAKSVGFTDWKLLRLPELSARPIL